MSEQCKQPQAHPSRCGCEQVKFCNIAALRAMAHNYADGHCWDHLDGKVVMRAADEITTLQAECERLTKALKKANDQAEKFERLWYLLGDELEAIKAKEPVGYFVHNGRHWDEVNPQFQDDADVHALYAAPTITKINTKSGTHEND